MNDIVFLTDAEHLPEGGGVFRAGGTDLQERLRSTNAAPRILDLMGIDDFVGIRFGAGQGLVEDATGAAAAGDESGDAGDGAGQHDGGGEHHVRLGGGTRIGAGTRMSVVADGLIESYPALAKTTASLATPQVRAVGTIGGNLLQHTRCWYARHPDLSCFKTGGYSCPARDGRHLYGVVFDTSDCVHPHPSSMAMALLLYDAEVAVAGAGRRTVAELLGDGSDPRRDNLLGEGEVVTAVHLPQPWEHERAAYFRSISRFEAEWPLVEAVCRVRLADDGSVADCGIGVGGVAPVPLRMRHAEDLLRGAHLDHDTIVAVSQEAADAEPASS